MTKLQKNLIDEKKEIFKGFLIPWDVKIEQDFEAKVAANPMQDMQYILDRIVRPYIDRQLEKDTFPTKRTYRKRCKANVNN